MGKALLATILAGVFAVGLAAPAVARSDTRVEIWCETEQGEQMIWKVVDVNAIQLARIRAGSTTRSPTSTTTTRTASIARSGPSRNPGAASVRETWVTQSPTTR